MTEEEYQQKARDTASWAVFIAFVAILCEVGLTILIALALIKYILGN